MAKSKKRKRVKDDEAGKKKHEKKSKIESKKSLIPSIYHQDLGDEGLKMTGQHDKDREASNEEWFQIRSSTEEINRRKQRKKRFGDIQKNKESSNLKNDNDNNNNMEQKSSLLFQSNSSSSTTQKTALVGTCRNLEKPFLRLTTFPNPNTVRPLNILKQSFQHVKTKYLDTHDWEWTHEQLKSIRQDLILQSSTITDQDFVLQVYQTHARLCIQYAELHELHSCLIKILKDSSSSSEKEILDEFGAYRILYGLIFNQRKAIKKTMWTSSLQQEQQTPCCRHAISVVLAITNCNYVSYFRLLETAPNMSAYLMDHLTPKVRHSALSSLLAAHRPYMTVQQLRDLLHFEDMEQTRTFLNLRPYIVYHGQDEPPVSIDCKASSIAAKTFTDTDETALLEAEIETAIRKLKYCFD